MASSPITMMKMKLNNCSPPSTAAAARFLPLLGPHQIRFRSSLALFHNPSFPRTIITRSTFSSSSIITAAMASEASVKVIDGKKVAKDVRDEINAEITRMKDSIGVVPGLAVILVGDRKDSATYVRNKKKACETAGIKSYEVCLPENSTEEEVLKYISDFNDDPMVHGILVQLPLPSCLVAAGCSPAPVLFVTDSLLLPACCYCFFHLH
ncbi:hypothetical protein AABB24_001438 [Solanum stoloniferum]|uniref:methenyltetrahydrofolate cyclohydrolase n=1 Tax=Solanum stoloniferum TaxID=62892 RepID=A0ABD2VKM8_9SOLN